MPRHLPLVLILALSVAFVAFHGVYSTHLLSPMDKPIQITSHKQPDKPDFSAIAAGNERKHAFFSFLKPFIEQQNNALLSLRNELHNQALSEERLHLLAKQYRIKSTDLSSIKRQLLIKVDAIPASLVLSQAAIESAWGTSRFAVEGNNYFGQWCFRKGCGLIPTHRAEGKAHEVRVFPSAFESVSAYMNNLNSHPAYKDLRAVRAELQQQQASSGCYMASGLKDYSEKGQAYVESLKLMIRSNRLEPDPSGYCAPVLLAEEEAAEDASIETDSIPQIDEEASQSTTIATDDNQSAVDPSVDETLTPSS